MNVIFKRFDNSEILAIFPDTEQHLVGQSLVESYSSVNKHRSIDSSYIYDLPNASYSQYKALSEELEEIGYVGIKILNKRLQVL